MIATDQHKIVPEWTSFDPHDGAGEVVFRLSDDGTIIGVTASCGPMLGHEPRDLHGAAFWSIVHRDDRTDLKAVWVMRRATGAAAPRRIRLLNARGVPVSLLVGLHMLPPAGDGPVEHVVTCRRDGLREPAPVPVEALVASAPDAMLAVSADGRIMLSNARAAQLFGWDQQTLASMRVEDLLPGRFRERHQRSRSGYVGDPHTREMGSGHEFMALHRNGHEISVDISLSPVETADGPLVLCAVRDVTAVRQTERALRESLRRFRAIFDSMFQFIGLMTPDGILVDANQTALEFAGRMAEEEVGRPFWMCSWWSDSAERQERLRAAIAEAASGRFVRYETEVTGAGGRTAIIDFSIKPVYDDEGALVLLIPEGRDVTERYLAVRALRYHDAILGAVGFASEAFLSAASWETRIDDVLATLGVAAEASRVGLFENSAGGQSFGLRAEWVAEGVAPLCEPLRVAAWDRPETARWAGLLAHGVPVAGPADRFPEIEQEYLRRMGIRSCVRVPIFAGGAWWGYIGIDECRRDRVWTDAEVDAFRVAAATLGAAIQRRVDERALRESEERFSKAFALAPVAIKIASLESDHIINVNDAYVHLTGFAPHEVIGRTTLDLRLHVRPQHYQRLLRMLREHGRYQNQEMQIRTRTGEIRHILASADVIEIGGEQCVLSMLHDVTDRRQLERTVARVSAGEQRQIGYHLHEDLAQRLASIALLSGIHLQHLEEEAPTQVGAMRRITQMLAEAISFSRNLSRRLTPVDLQPDGLIFALRNLTENVALSRGILCRFEAPTSVMIRDIDVATYLYRIAQEAIDNALNHGDPGEILVELDSVRGQGVLRVRVFHERGEERGAPEATALDAMKYRAEVIGASLDVRRGTRGDTVIECHFDS